MNGQPRRTLLGDIVRLVDWAFDHPALGYVVAFLAGVAYTLAVLDL